VNCDQICKALQNVREDITRHLVHEATVSVELLSDHFGAWPPD